jgi:hypothetical protein
MAAKPYGRIDWRPRLNRWAAVWYSGSHDERIGLYATQEDAGAALQAKIHGGRLQISPEPFPHREA